MNRKISEESNRNYRTLNPLQVQALKSFHATRNVGDHKLILTIRHES